MAGVITRRTEAAVEFHHVDMMQVVHNSQYFRWFELGRMQLLEDIFPVSWAVENKVATPVVENHCEYLWPAQYGDRLVITTRHRLADRYDGRFRFDHSISNKRTKRELCSGYTTVTVLDMGTRILLKEIPEEIWNKYRALK